MKAILSFLWLLFVWTVVKSKVTVISFSPTYYVYYGKQKARWYSPTAWLTLIILSLYAAYDGGIKEFYEETVEGSFTYCDIRTKTVSLRKPVKSWLNKKWYFEWKALWHATKSAAD